MLTSVRIETENIKTAILDPSRMAMHSNDRPGSYEQEIWLVLIINDGRSKPITLPQCLRRSTHAW
jgi:hypothetical protein